MYYLLLPSSSPSLSDRTLVHMCFHHHLLSFVAVHNLYHTRFRSHTPWRHCWWPNSSITFSSGRGACYRLCELYPHLQHRVSAPRAPLLLRAEQIDQNILLKDRDPMSSRVSVILLNPSTLLPFPLVQKQSLFSPQHLIEF